MSVPRKPAPTLREAARALDARPQEAAAAAQAVLARSPLDARALLVLGAARRRLGAFSAARAVLAPLAKAQPHAAHVHLELGLALAGLAEADGAIAALRRAVALAPGLAEARFALAARLFHGQAPAEAIALLEPLLEASPGEARYVELDAACRQMTGACGEAAAHLTALLAAHPERSRAWIALGHALRGDGRPAEAAAAYRRRLALAPGDGEAWWSLANLKTPGALQAADAEVMRTQLARPDLPDEDRVPLEFALGHALDEAGDFAAAFAGFGRGAALHRRGARHDRDAAARAAARTRAVLDRAFFAARAGGGFPGAAPLFVVGLPRSGSTLVAQILAAHPAVESLGEPPALMAIARELKGYPDCLAALGEAERAALGRRYVEAVRPYRRTDRPVFIDKTPNNFHHVGLIRLILPEARVIDARRHPLAAGLAVFKQHFARGHAFSYDLADIGRYYRDYVDLMAHWDAVLPGFVRRVLNEAVVADLEGEARALLDHAGLPFDPACLRFFEASGPARTPSAEQVRRPLYREGLDHWRRYEPWLDPLKAALGPALSTWDAGRR